MLRDFVFPLDKEVISHGGEEKDCVHGEDGGNRSRRDRAAAAVDEGANEGEDHVDSAVVFCFGHAGVCCLG